MRVHIHISVVMALLIASSVAAQSISPPGVTALAPGVVTTDGFEINAVFNKDSSSVIFSRCENNFTACRLVMSKYQQGKWQAPEVLSFSGQFTDADPYYSEDFKSLYFISKRPIDGSKKELEHYNLWRVDRDGDSWSTPEYLQSLSSDKHDLYPSLAADGTLYFPSFRGNKRLLYRSEPVESGFSAPEPMPAELFGEKGQVGDTVVWRNEKVMVLSIRARPDSKGRGDLYVSYFKDGQWTVAESLGELVNTPEHEFCPIFSPDGQTFYFTRIEKGVGNVYQVSVAELGIRLN